MYGIYANIEGILMVNVTIYSIHGSYGKGNQLIFGYHLQPICIPLLRRLVMFVPLRLTPAQQETARNGPVRIIWERSASPQNWRKEKKTSNTQLCGNWTRPKQVELEDMLAKLWIPILSTVLNWNAHHDMPSCVWSWLASPYVHIIRCKKKSPCAFLMKLEDSGTHRVWIIISGTEPSFLHASVYTMPWKAAPFGHLPSLPNDPAGAPICQTSTNIYPKHALYL